MSCLIPRRRYRAWLLVLGVIILAGCTKYIDQTVKVTPGDISAPYILKIQNLTDTEITILPADLEGSDQVPEQRLKPQDTFDVELKVRRLQVEGEGTGVRVQQVVPGPYIDASESDVAVIATEHSDGDEYRIQVWLKSKDWLEPPDTGASANANPAPEPLVLPIAIVDFDKEYWYRDGPKGSP